MARLIKFPLYLKNEEQVRNLEELREHFDMEALLGYYENGKLDKWLESRHLEKERERIKALSYRYKDCLEQMCLLFGVPYLEEYNELYIRKDKERLSRREAWIRKNTDDGRYLKMAERLIYVDRQRVIVFGEDRTTVDVYRLSDGAKKTMLTNVCAEIFIPLDRQSMAFLTAEEDVQIVSQNLVTGDAHVLAKITSGEHPVPVFRPVFGKDEEGIFLMYQREDHVAAEYEKICVVLNNQKE